MASRTPRQAVSYREWNAQDTLALVEALDSMSADAGWEDVVCGLGAIDVVVGMNRAMAAQWFVRLE